VTVTVEKDVDAVVSDVKTFVQTYNDVVDRIAQQTSFNAETEQRGILLGEPTVSTVQSRLSNLILSPLSGAAGGFEYAYAVGLSLGAGGRLTFDEEAFREAVDESPERVEQLFTTEETGLAARLEGALDELTDSFDGLLTRRDETLGQREELLSDRIDDLTVRLEARRALLTAQFQAMERSLAALQSQQNALIGLNSLMTIAGTGLSSGQ